MYHTVVIKDEQWFWKRILIVDDDADITVTFKTRIEDSNNYNANRRIEVYTYNNPLIALSEFKPNFYDCLLVDINMPHMNGFELCEKILAIDINVRVCFMSSAEINPEPLREIYPSQIGCFIRKPVTIDYLVKRIMSELAYERRILKYMRKPNHNYALLLIWPEIQNIGIYMCTYVLVHMSLKSPIIVSETSSRVQHNV